MLIFPIAGARSPWVYRKLAQPFFMVLIIMNFAQLALPPEPFSFVPCAVHQTFPIDYMAGK